MIRIFFFGFVFKLIDILRRFQRIWQAIPQSWSNIRDIPYSGWDRCVEISPDEGAGNMTLIEFYML